MTPPPALAAIAERAVSRHDQLRRIERTLGALDDRIATLVALDLGLDPPAAPPPPSARLFVAWPLPALRVLRREAERELVGLKSAAPFPPDPSDLARRRLYFVLDAAWFLDALVELRAARGSIAPDDRAAAEAIALDEPALRTTALGLVAVRHRAPLLEVERALAGPETGGERRRLARRSELPLGRPVGIDAFGARWALVATPSGVVGLGGVCPHRGAALEDGHVEGGALVCPFHRWPFDLASGHCRTHRAKVPTLQIDIEGDEVYGRLA